MHALALTCTLSIPLPNLKRQRCHIHFLLLTWYFSNLFNLPFFSLPIFFFFFSPPFFLLLPASRTRMCPFPAYLNLKHKTESLTTISRFSHQPTTAKHLVASKIWFLVLWGGVSTVFPSTIGTCSRTKFWTTRMVNTLWSLCVV